MLATRVVVGMFSVGMVFLSANTLASEVYPNRPVRILVSTPGGAGDNAARIIEPGLTRSLGQPVVVDNRSYGNASIEIVSKALPDGYTLVITGNQFLFGHLLQTMNYDPVKDFTPISLLGITPSILTVPPILEANSVKELIALAKAKPGVLNYASGGAGGTSHLSGELFKALASVNIVRIPYKGNPMVGLMGGEVQLAFDNPSMVVPLAKSGKVKALAVTSARPSALIPGLPTIAASLPGYEMVTMAVAFAPAKTPGPIIGRLNQDIVRILNTTEVKERFFNGGVEVVGSSPEELAATHKSAIARIGKLIKDAGIRVQ